MAPELDQLLTPDDAAKWIGISRRELAEKSSGRKPLIPVISIGHKTKRYHLRTILAAFAERSGVSPQTITAAMQATRKEA